MEPERHPLSTLLREVDEATPLGGQKKLCDHISAQCVLVARSCTELTNAIEEAHPVRNSHLAEALEQLSIAQQAIKKAWMEILYVKIPRWIQRWTGNAHTHWLVKRCLPGQRNAALRWHQHIGGLCEQADLEAFPSAPTILRHRDLSRKVFVNIHVDDILLVCNPGDVGCFQSTVGATLTMKVDGPHAPGSGSQLMCLKKKKDNEAWWNFASTQFHLHPKTCGVDESQWEEKERVTIPCYIGEFQRRPGDRGRDAGL